MAAWWVENYELFGFQHVELIPQKGRQPQYGDFIAWRGGRQYRGELEECSSNFFNHKPEVRNVIDIIVCYKKNSSRNQSKVEELAHKEVIEIGWILIGCELCRVLRESQAEKYFPKLLKVAV